MLALIDIERQWHSDKYRKIMRSVTETRWPDIDEICMQRQTK